MDVYREASSSDGRRRSLIDRPLALLAVAIAVPSLGVGVGALLAVPIESLGGLMVAYWLFVLASLLSAGIRVTTDLLRDRLPPSSTSILPIALAAVAVTGPVALKATASTPPQGEVQLATDQGPGSVSPDGCQTVLGNPGAPTRFSKTGGSGRLAWYFGIGNHYEWHLEGRISADNSSAGGEVIVTGYSSPWYSFRAHRRRAYATAEAMVQCVETSTGCAPVALSAKDVQPDGDFVASVVVTASERAGLAIVDVDVTAQVSGTMAISGVSIGVEKGPAKFGGNLSIPNNATDSSQKAKGFYYHCIKKG